MPRLPAAPQPRTPALAPPRMRARGPAGWAFAAGFGWAVPWIGGCPFATPGSVLRDDADGTAAADADSPAEDPSAIPTVDALCQAPSPAEGDPWATETQVLAAQRLACHRDAADLPKVVLDHALQVAAQAHASYMAATGDYGHVEGDPEHPTSSGADALARVQAAGLTVDLATTRIEEVVAFVQGGIEAGAAVDLWVGTVYHRRPLLHPLTTRVGFGFADPYAVALALGPWDTAATGAATVVGTYPGDAQEGVPATFDSDRENPDPAPDHGLVGYPITVTVATGAWGPEATNPFDIRVDRDLATLVDARGDAVPVLILDPTRDPALLDTVAMVPEAALEPEAWYEVRLALTVAGEGLELAWAFETGS